MYLAFGLLSILGLRAPLKFVPILLLQMVYKLVWYAGVILPLLLVGNLPEDALQIVTFWSTVVISDLVKFHSHTSLTGIRQGRIK